MGQGKIFGIAVGITLLVAILASLKWDATASPPVAEVTAMMQENTAGSLVVQLSAAQSFDAEGNVVVYQWVFGDGTTGSGESVVHTYPSPGTYLMTLFVADDQGETARITEQIMIPIEAQTVSPTPTSAHPASARMDRTAGLSIGSSVGQLAPEFALESLDGERFVLSEARGFVVVLDFWSSGCGACQATMPRLVGVQQQLPAGNILFVGISLDRDASSAARYIARYGFQGITLWQSVSASRSVMTRYGVSSVPTTFVIDPSGVVRFRGYRSELDAEIVQSIVRMANG